MGRLIFFLKFQFFFVLMESGVNAPSAKSQYSLITISGNRPVYQSCHKLNEAHPSLIFTSPLPPLVPKQQPLLVYLCVFALCFSSNATPDPGDDRIVRHLMQSRTKANPHKGQSVPASHLSSNTFPASYTYGY